MNPRPMSYGGYVWPRNPAQIRVERAKNVAQFKVPGGPGAVQETGAAPLRVSGAGRFTGPGCREELARLSAAFAAGGTGPLRLPGGKPFAAVFAALTLKGEPGPDRADYEFLFLEDAEDGESARREPPEPYVCGGGETLWDIAAARGVPVDALLALNPQVEWPDAPAAGEKVALP